MGIKKGVRMNTMKKILLTMTTVALVANGALAAERHRRIKAEAELKTLRAAAE